MRCTCLVVWIVTRVIRVIKVSRDGAVMVIGEVLEHGYLDILQHGLAHDPLDPIQPAITLSCRVTGAAHVGQQADDVVSEQQRVQLARQVDGEVV